MNCPVCGSKTTGKVGVDQYFCWDCCVEYKKHKDDVSVYEVDEDGTLSAYGVQDQIQ